MTDPAAPVTHRITRMSGVVGLAAAASEDEARAAAQRLRSRYVTVPGLEDWQLDWVWLPAARALVAVTGEQPPSLHEDCVVVWGCPVGATGPATDAEVLAALEDPARARDLEGAFVLVRVLPHVVRTVTSSAYVHTLRRSDDSFATRAAGAVALAGRPLAVDRDHVVEAVVWQAVLQDGEVLAGVRACEEATVVELDRSGVRERSWWSLADRLLPGQPPTVQGFRDQLQSLLTRHARVPGARLALTGGRDSTLMASCLADAGVQVRAFTMGPLHFPDVRAAKATCALLGWEHEHLPVADNHGRRSRFVPPRLTVPGRRLSSWLVRHAPWGEGLQHPRDALVGRLPRTAPFPALAGHGGEVARAYFWEGRPDHDPVDMLVSRGTAAHLEPRCRDQYADVVRADVQLLEGLGRRDAVLDLILARRLRSWLDHGWLPDAPVHDVLSAYMASEVIRAMVDVPVADRLGNRFFDQVLTASRPELWQSAMDSLASRGGYWRALGRLNPAVPRDDWPLLRTVLDELEPEGLLVREVMGDGWWQGAVAAARENPGARGPIWNAVAVEAVHRCT